MILPCAVSEADDHIFSLMDVILLDALVHDGESHRVAESVVGILEKLKDKILLCPFLAGSGCSAQRADDFFDSSFKLHGLKIYDGLNSISIVISS